MRTPNLSSSHEATLRIAEADPLTYERNEYLKGGEDAIIILYLETGRKLEISTPLIYIQQRCRATIAGRNKANRRNLANMPSTTGEGVVKEVFGRKAKGVAEGLYGCRDYKD